MHVFIKAFLISFGAMFPLVNPIGHAPMFYVMTIRDTVSGRRKIAIHTSIYLFLILLISLILGQYILRFFGVNLDDIRIGGGLLVAVSAWQMLEDTSFNTDPDNSVSGSSSRGDIALTPLATPILAGPGAMSLAIGLTSYGHTPICYLGYVFGFLAVALVTLVSFDCSHYLAKILGRHALGAINRILGFLILAIGIDLMLTGLKNYFFLNPHTF
jgi:multiple antibiotic resistance protein